MRIAGIQADVAWESPEENFSRLSPRVADAAAAGARVVLLSEMFGTGFSMTAGIAESPGGPTEEFLREQAGKHNIWIGGSCPVRTATDELPYNRFVLVSPEGERTHYDKIHPFGYGGETDHYRAGTAAVTVELDGLRCSLFVCYDLRFADRFWALAEVTDCYFVVANWPAARADHWRTLLRARAIENLAYAVGVNRVGVGDGIAYAGGSLVVDPFGETVAEAGDGECVLVGDVERERVAAVRDRYRFLEDR